LGDGYDGLRSSVATVVRPLRLLNYIGAVLVRVRRDDRHALQPLVTLTPIYLHGLERGLFCAYPYLYELTFGKCSN